MAGRAPVPHGSAVRGFGNGFLRFSTGVGRVIKPAVWPLAAAAGAGYVLPRLGDNIDAIGNAVNPPLDRTPVDLNGDGVPETYVIFDRKTGLLNSYGQPPAAAQENDRQEFGKLTVLVVAAGAVAAVALLSRGGGK